MQVSDPTHRYFNPDTTHTIYFLNGVSLNPVLDTERRLPAFRK